MVHSAMVPRCGSARSGSAGETGSSPTGAGMVEAGESAVFSGITASILYRAPNVSAWPFRFLQGRGLESELIRGSLVTLIRNASAPCAATAGPFETHVL